MPELSLTTIPHEDSSPLDGEKPVPTGPIAMLMTLNGTIIDTSGPFLGYPRQLLPGIELSELSLHGGAFETKFARFSDTLQPGQAAALETTLLDCDNEPRSIRLECILATLDGEVIIKALGTESLMARRNTTLQEDSLQDLLVEMDRRINALVGKGRELDALSSLQDKRVKTLDETSRKMSRATRKAARALERAKASLARVGMRLPGPHDPRSGEHDDETS